MISHDLTSHDHGHANSTGTVTWSYLRPHQICETLYFVDPSLELEFVGAALVGNQADAVKAMMKSGDLVKIEAIHATQWENGNQEFEVLIVSPFVLCRPV